MFKITVQCKTHPKYKGLLKPRCECEDCERVFEFRTELDNFEGDSHYYNIYSSIIKKVE